MRDIRTYIKVVPIHGPAQLAQLFNHDTRSSSPPNANPELPHLNRTLVPLPEGETIMDAWYRVAGKATRHPLALWASQLTVMYPSLWVAQNRILERDALADASTEFLHKRFGDRLIHGTMHCDELTDHLQYVLIPLDPKSNRVAQRRVMDGPEIRSLNHDYHEKVLKGFGIGSSFSGSRPSHKDIREFDRAVKAPTEEIQFSPEEIPEPPLIRTKKSNQEYAQRVAQRLTELANEKNRSTAIKAKSVDIYRTKVEDHERTLRAKENHLARLRTEHTAQTEALQIELARETAAANKYRDLTQWTLDASAVLEFLGFRARINGPAKEFRGVAEFDVVSVTDDCATATQDQGKEPVSVDPVQLTQKATGWSMGQCYAFLVANFGHKAQGALFKHVERLAARSKHDAPEFNLPADDVGWTRATAPISPDVPIASLEHAHRQRKVIADTQGRIVFCLSDASKQVRGVVVYAEGDIHEPVREFGGGPGIAFALGSPAAPNRVLCLTPWDVLQVDADAPTGSVFAFCGTSRQPAVELLFPKTLSVRASVFGFAPNSPAKADLERRLGATRTANLHEYVPKMFSGWPPDTVNLPKVEVDPAEHGRIERDSDEMDWGMAG